MKNSAFYAYNGTLPFKKGLKHFSTVMQVEKSQGEIYRLRAKLENTQSENENIQEEFDKIQQALSR
jgi:hypothetical protein